MLNVALQQHEYLQRIGLGVCFIRQDEYYARENRLNGKAGGRLEHARSPPVICRKG
jgi:hypothetical protein